MIIDNEEIVIQISKTKAIVMTIIAIIVACACIFLWTKIHMTSSFNRNFILIGTSAIFIFSGLGIIQGLRMILMTKPGLTITNDGICNNIGPCCGLFIKWTDVANIEVRQSMRGSLFLLIFVKNPQDYSDKANGYNRFLMNMNSKSHGTPLSITTNWLKCNIEELANILENKKNAA